MRILLSTDVTVRGGVDRYVFDLAEALGRSGHAPVLLLEETTTSALRYNSARLSGLPVHYAALYHRRHDPERLRASSAEVIDEIRPDGVHIACGSPFSCLSLREAVVGHGIPLVITEQYVDDGLVLSPGERLRIRSTYRSAKQVVFVSHGNRNTMARLIGFRSVSTRVVPNGVDVAQIQARADAMARPARIGGARVMTAARLSREKGLDILVRAVAALPKLVGEANVYGEGPERATLERLLAKLGLAERVTLHRWTPNIPELMAQHDLFVLPSTAEGMPYAVLEAMSAGIPVVASDLPGNVEALAGGLAGTLVPRRDVSALATAIAFRLDDPARTAALARVARERVRAHYDLSVQMCRTVALWAGR